MSPKSRHRLAHLAWFVAAAALPAAPAAAQVQLNAGAAVAQLTLPEGVPLAGYSGRRAAVPDVLDLYPYAYYFPPSAGGHAGEEIRVKALVLERGGTKLVFVSLDTVGVDRKLRKSITDELAVAPLLFAVDNVLISATHTHSGPGALTANHFLEYAATDRLHADLRASIVSQVVAVVTSAVAGLRPASLFHFTVDAKILHTNRSRDPNHGDHTLSLLAVREKASATWIGALVNFAVHGTARDHKNNQLSADYPGALERAFAKAMGQADLPVLFLNGAEGDSRPTKKPDVMQPELDVWAQARWTDWWNVSPAPAPLPVSEWKIGTRKVELGHSFMYLRAELKPFQDTFPISRLGMELGTYFPRRVKIWSISIAGLRFLTIPGEPTTDVGLELREMVNQELGVTTPVWILGLTNDHVGYFASRKDWKAATYESTNSTYGAYGSRRLVNAHLCLLRE